MVNGTALSFSTTKMQKTAKIQCNVEFVTRHLIPQIPSYYHGFTVVPLMEVKVHSVFVDANKVKSGSQFTFPQL